MGLCLLWAFWASLIVGFRSGLHAPPVLRSSEPVEGAKEDALCCAYMEKRRTGICGSRSVMETHKIIGVPQNYTRVFLIGLMLGALDLIPLITWADVIVFKDGRKMSVEKAWVEEGEVKAKVYGGIVGYPKESVARIEEEQPSARVAEGAFKFDKWVSGMAVDEVMKVAETHDVPILKVGVVSGGKHFNPEVRKYAKTATAFYYKDNLLGKWSTVTLSFSPVSKLLWSVSINWSGPGVSTKGEFRNDVQSLLSEKYGKPKDGGKDLFYETTSWKISEISVVSMKVGAGSVNVTYVDKKIEAIKRNEDLQLKEEEKQKALLKDKSKY
jgi:hypothetical protein